MFMAIAIVLVLLKRIFYLYIFPQSLVLGSPRWSDMFWEITRQEFAVALKRKFIAQAMFPRYISFLLSGFGVTKKEMTEFFILCGAIAVALKRKLALI